MKRTFVLFLMSLSMLLSSPSCAEEHGLANHVTGMKVEHVEKVDTAQAASVNKEIALRNCKVILTEEVEEYIGSKTKKFDRDISKHLVEECLNNDIDICFALAQAQIETNFGTIGIGKSRRSMYGVYVTFKSRKHSTTHYIRLLKTNYLGSKKTIHHLMKNYVTLKGGHRYSSNPKYESELKKAYQEIVRNTKISKLQDECNKLSEGLM